MSPSSEVVSVNASAVCRAVAAQPAPRLRRLATHLSTSVRRGQYRGMYEADDDKTRVAIRWVAQRGNPGR